ncbi:MAG TPA: Ig-like domain-containing protein, partial [Pseudonocardiaceae bacterium]
MAIATATGLTSTANPSVCGQFITITATVVSVPPSGTPTGNVDFVIDGTPLTGELDTNGQATVELFFTTGTHIIDATYVGDGTFDPSVAPTLTQITDQATATTVVTSSVNPSVCCEPVTFTITVTEDPPSTAGPPTGTVTLSVDGVPGAPVSLSDGTATVTDSSLTPGAHTITATYSGDTCYFGSTSAPLTQNVNPATATVTVGSAPNPSTCCAPVTFTVDVAPLAPATCTPTGTVTIVVDDVPDGSATLVDGAATVVNSNLTAGSHTIVASYSGDSCFAATTSSASTQTVTQASTTTTLTSAPNPSECCGPVVFTVVVADSNPDCVPSGTVTITVDDVPGTPLALVDGTATFTDSTLAAGTHTASATYSGDACFTASTSAPVTQTVTQTASATTITTVTPDPATCCDPVDVTIVVTGPAPDCGPTDGTLVTLTIDGTPDGSAALVAGAATITIPAGTLSVGAHTLTATFPGDTCLLGSTSTPVTQTVTQAASTTTLSTAPNPSTCCDAVTATVTVAGPTPACAPADGTLVTLTIDGVADGTAALTGGTATITIPAGTLSIGAHTLTATFPGDTCLLGSTSAPVTQTVTQAASTTTLSTAPNPSTCCDAVTATITVAGPTPDCAPTDGTLVTLTIDGIPDGTAALVAGSATLTIPAGTLTTGTHTLTVSYPGDTCLLASTSTPVIQTVTQAASTTTL